jgi:hypothetical protein
LLIVVLAVMVVTNRYGLEVGWWDIFIKLTPFQ